MSHSAPSDVSLAHVSSTSVNEFFDEYRSLKDKTTLWKSIVAGSFRKEVEPMPVLTINMKDVPWMQVSPTEARPMVRLPSTGTECLRPPSGLTNDESFQWELAKFLEGRSACIEHLPSFKPGSASLTASMYLGWACRHADVLRDSPDNWLPLTWMLRHSPHKLGTPSDLFQAVIHNEKGRYQFSKPQYFKATGKRETQGMGRGVDVEPFFHVRIHVRAVQGHSKSMKPEAAMTAINEDNAPPNAVHGTSIKATLRILKEGLVPGGYKPDQGQKTITAKAGSHAAQLQQMELQKATDSEDRLAQVSSASRQAVHFAATLPNDASHVVSGYRTSSEVCIFFDLMSWIEDHEAWYSANKVVCVFEVIPPKYLLAAVRVSDCWDYVLGDWAEESYVSKLRLQQLGSAATPDSRMRAEEQDPETRVRTSHLAFTNNPTVRNIVSEAEAEDDPTSITPISKISSWPRRPSPHSAKSPPKITCSMTRPKRFLKLL